MKKSESIGLIAAALTRVVLPAIKRSGYNPDTRSNFAKLEEIIDEVRPLLQAEKVVILQDANEDSPPNMIYITTTLLHESGEWISGSSGVTVIGRRKAKDDGGGFHPPDAQAWGGGQSYARRYSLTALLCIATEDDDDGNRATRRGQRQIARQATRQEHGAPVPGQPLDPKLMPVGENRGSPIAEKSVATLRRALQFCRQGKLVAEEAVILGEIKRRGNEAAAAEQLLRDAAGAPATDAGA